MGMRKGYTIPKSMRYAYDLLHLAWWEGKIFAWWVYNADEWEIAWTETNRVVYTGDEIRGLFRKMTGKSAPRARRTPITECPHCGGSLKSATSRAA